MAGESTTNGLAGIRPTKGAPDIILQVHDNAIFQGTVNWQDSMGYAATTMGRATSTTSATAVANGANEADQQSASELTTSVSTATPAMKAVFVVLSFISAMTTQTDLKGFASKTIAIALANKLDSDITALFGGFSTVVGTSGVGLTVQDTITAAMNLRVNAGNRAGDAMWGLHPKQIADLVSSASNNNSPFAAMQLEGFDTRFGQSARSNSHGLLQGFPCLSSTQVGTVNAGADRGGALYVTPSASGAGAAIGGAMLAIQQGSEDSMLPQRQLADALSGWSAYGVIEEMDVFGVLVQSDA